MFCTKCGTQVPDGNSFCQNCGNRIDVRVATKPAAAPGLKMPRNADSFISAAPAEPAVNAAFKPAAGFNVAGGLGGAVSQPPVEPAYQPNPEPVYQPPAEPAYQPNPEPVYQPPAEPAYQPNPEPAYQPNPEPVYHQPETPEAGKVRPAKPVKPAEKPVKAAKPGLSLGAKILALAGGVLLLAAAALTWFLNFHLAFKLSIKDGTYVLDGETSPILNNLSLKDLHLLPFMIGMMAALAIAGILLLLCGFGVIRNRGVLAGAGVLGLLGLAPFAYVFIKVIKDLGTNWQSYLPENWRTYLDEAFAAGREVITTETVPVTTSLSLFGMNDIGWAVPGLAGLGSLLGIVGSFFKKKEA